MICPYCSETTTNLKLHLLKCLTMIRKPRHPGMAYPELRQRTFKPSWPFVEEYVKCGFYFTGDFDTLACFWCNGLFGNWQVDDHPLEKHLYEYPHCLFAWELCQSISICKFCRKMVPISDISLPKHGDRCLKSSIAARNPAGTFPRNPRMEKTSLRLKTFELWPKKVPSAQSLVSSGFYYVGQGDVVTCFYCDGMLDCWLPLDIPFEKHVVHFPNCDFARSNLEIMQFLEFFNKVDMTLESNRIKSFKEANLDIDTKLLAESGFFYLKDYVKCAFCKIIIEQSDHEPMRRHIEKNPFCPFLRGTTLLKEPLYPKMIDPTDRLNSFVIQDKALDFVKNGFYQMNDLVKCFWCGFRMDCTEKHILKEHRMKRPECMFIQNVCFEEDLNKERMICTICLENIREVVFRDCGHMVSCKSCANKLSKCPICRKNIREKMRIYIN